jgi:nicotinamide riboside kinase
MKDDLPWQDDPLRNFPGERAYFMEWYTRLMEEKGAKYEIVDGIGNSRFEKAVKELGIKT